MSEETVLVVAQNTTGAWDVQALDSSGNPVPILSTDTLEAIVWGGLDAAPVATLEATLTDGPSGTLNVAISAVQSAAITPGIYPLEVAATRSAERLRILTAWLQVDSSPGSSTGTPTYCSYQDMVSAGGGAWLDALRSAGDYSLFAEERGKARVWLDELIARKWRPWATRRGWCDAGTTGPIDAPNKVVSDYLAANYLMVNQNITRLTALKSLQFVCEQRVTLEDDERFAKKANRFDALAENLCASTVALLDINADGYPEYAIHLGFTSIR